MSLRLEELLNRGVYEGVFPGCALGIWYRGKMALFYRGRTAWGREFPPVSENTWYDLASLTKPLATTLVAMDLFDKGLFDPLAPIKAFLSAPYPLSEVPVAYLLSHTSGLPSHRPYFARLLTYPPERRRQVFLYWLLNEPLCYPPGLKEMYSDLGFFLLGEILGLISETPFYVSAQRLYLRFGLSHGLTFFPLKRGILQDDIAPTEVCPWRGKLLWGDVHDENTWALGGAAGQAGLFGRLEAVVQLLACLYQIYRGEDGPLKGTTLEFFWHWRRQGTWALGFDRPEVQGLSMAGSLLSRESWGHLGFTGVSFWIDPQRDLIIVFLCNRVHPWRHNQKIKAFRPALHDLVVEELGNIFGGSSKGPFNE